MNENKRYVVMADTDLEVSLKDNITKKYPFSLICENIDEFEPLLNEVTNVCAELNKNWEQTLRFEDYNKELTQRSVKYEDTIDELKHENNELTSIKRFADNHGINISKIDEAFRKCWNDNGKLVKDNEQLKIENRKLMAYNSACEDTLLNVDVVLHRLIDKYCSKDVNGDVGICEVLQEFKNEIFPSIQPEIKLPIFEPVGRCRCIPVPVEIKKEKPEEVFKKVLEGIK